MMAHPASVILPPQGRCAHEKHYISRMHTPTKLCCPSKATPLSACPDLSPRQVSVALGVLALLSALVGSIAVHAEVISVPLADPSSSATPIPPPMVLRGSPPS